MTTETHRAIQRAADRLTDTAREAGAFCPLSVSFVGRRLEIDAESAVRAATLAADGLSATTTDPRIIRAAAAFRVALHRATEERTQ